MKSQARNSATHPLSPIRWLCWHVLLSLRGTLGSNSLSLGSWLTFAGHEVRLFRTAPLGRQPGPKYYLMNKVFSSQNSSVGCTPRIIEKCCPFVGVVVAVAVVGVRERSESQTRWDKSETRKINKRKVRLKTIFPQKRTGTEQISFNCPTIAIANTEKQRKYKRGECCCRLKPNIVTLTDQLRSQDVGMRLEWLFETKMQQGNGSGLSEEAIKP